MKLRVVTSLTALLSFAALAGTGLSLVVVPQGRVAAWSGWRLLGVGREEWIAVHLALGLLFLGAAIVHVVLNGGPLVSYLKDRTRKRLRLASPESVVAVALTATFVLGAVFRVPPVSWALAAGDAAKDGAARTLGEPPYGHAELSSLRTFAERMDLDPAAAKTLLARAGIRVGGDGERLADVAKANGLAPRDVWAAMKGAVREPAGATALPEEAASGLGRKTLDGLCSEYALDVAAIRTALSARGIAATGDQTLRAIAEAAGMGPHDLYGVIREIARGRKQASRDLPAQGDRRIV